MQYSDKEYQVLGKQVAAGRYVTRSTFALSIILALLAGLCFGRYVLPNESLPTEQKRPIDQGSGIASSLNQDKEMLQSIFRHEEDVRRDPSNSKAWEHLGNLYFDAGEPAKAVNAYNKALELNPDNADVLVDCGVMYRDLKEFDKALEYFNKALTLNPGHEHALFNSGVVLYFDLQKKDEALAKWRELLRINPEARMPSKERLSDMVESLSEK